MSKPWWQIEAMLALELMAIVALREDNPKLLAVVSEAWVEQGYGLDSLADTLPGPRDAAWSRIEKARYRRNRAKLLEQAKGMLAAIELLAAAGLLTERTINMGRWPNRDPALDLDALVRDVTGYLSGRSPGQPRADLRGDIASILGRHGLVRITPRVAE